MFNKDFQWPKFDQIFNIVIYLYMLQIGSQKYRKNVFKMLLSYLILCS
jgi:hypothetical protein